jgi:aspartyl-tRNA(Asn)/glutamyl-tRNA(Gln) amidotransferase subunit C
MINLPNVVDPKCHDVFYCLFLLLVSVAWSLLMRLTIDEVRHVAELAKLRLSEAELALYAEQLSAILDHAESLQQVDTSQVAPTPYVLPLYNVMADDAPAPSLDNAVALANAPDKADGFFRVRAVFEE